MTKKIALAVSIVLLIAGVFAVGSGLRHEPAATQTSTDQTTGQYIALGDSVAAGVGLKDYSDASACNRTKQAYPNVIADKRQYRLTSVACSGATTSDGIIGRQGVNRLSVSPQIDSLMRTGSTQPKLITMTIGANDAGWIGAIQKCYTAVCGSEVDTTAVQAGLATAQRNLDQAFNQIRERYPKTTPAVALTGYYEPFPSQLNQDCAEATGISSGELQWIRQTRQMIDEALQASAQKYAFVTFVPIDFSGHQFCSADPWIQGLGDRAPYHPTAAGETAMANQILQALDKKK